MNRAQKFLAFAVASALAALPVLVFSGWGWYPSIDFFKWALTFPLAAYGAGCAAYALAAGRAEITRIELAWLALALLSLAQPLVIPIRASAEWLRNVYFFAALGGAAFALRNLPIDEALPWILRAYSVTGGISTLFGFIQRVAPHSGLPFILDASLAPDRFLANTGLDNTLGAYLALAVIAGIWLLLHGGGHKFARAVKSLDVALIAVNCVGLWKAGTRSAFIAAIAGTLALLAASRFRPGIWKKFLASLAVTEAAAAAIAVCVSLAAPGSLRVERRDMTRLFSPESLAGEGRLVIWGVTLEMIKGAPILGRGLGNYKWNYLDAMASYRERSATPPRYTRWAHNEYLQWIAETGLVFPQR